MTTMAKSRRYKRPPFSTSPPEDGDCCDACDGARSALSLNHPSLFPTNLGMAIFCRPCAEEAIDELTKALLRVNR